MGHERKRGKLADLNALLSGARKRCVFPYRRQYGGAVGSEICHHARYRYSVAAGDRPSIRGCDGSPAESPEARRKLRGGEESHW